MKRIFIKAISIILFISLLTGCFFNVNIPGLSSAPKEYVPSSDETVIKLLEQNKDKTPEELILISIDLSKNRKYKEAYNIAKMMMLDNTQDNDIIAGAYALMGANYLWAGGFEKAKYYNEKALALIEQCEYSTTIAFVQLHAGAMYYNISVRDEWRYASEGIENLEDSLSEWIQYSNERETARVVYSFLNWFYFECPEYFDGEKAANYAYQAFSIDPIGSRDLDSTWYSIAMAYLVAGDYESAEEYVVSYINRPPIRQYNRDALHLFYRTVKGDMDMAKELADSMKRVEPFGSAPFSKTARLFGYPMLGYYSEAIGDTEAAKEYYYEYINSDEGLINANTKFIVDAEERLGMDFSEARARLMQEIIDGRSISLELAGVEDEPPFFL